MNRQPELVIKKKTGISIHQQLVTQLAMQITSGQLPTGSKLPSVRALSRKLGIHYNTCLAAYRELENLRLIEIRQGSGVKVAQIEAQQAMPDIKNLELDQMSRYFMQQALKRGYTWDEIRKSATQAYQQLAETSQKTIVWVDEHSDIIPIFRAELSEALSQPVIGVSFSDLASLPEGDYCYVVSRYHFHKLQKVVDSDAQIIVVEVASGKEEIDYVKKLPTGSFMTVVSHSTTVLRQAEAVIAAVRGQDLLLRGVLHGEGPEEIEKAVRHGQFVLTDVLNTPMVKSLTRKPVHTIRLLPESELDKIRAALS